MAVIGAGPGGYVAAIRAAQLGQKVVIFEKQHLGGICLNWGCIPTKALLRSAEILHLAQSASDYGITTGPITIDMPKIISRSRKIAATLQQGVRSLLQKNKVQIVQHYAKILSPSVVEAAGLSYQAKNIIIATGARAKTIKGLEPDGVRVLTYKEAMLQEEVPAKIAIIGAGAIGVEFASFYNTLGSKVTLIEMQESILHQEDKDIRSLAAKELSAKGIVIHTATLVKSLLKKDNVILTLQSGGQEFPLDVTKVIVAAGVVANTCDLGLKNTKVEVRDNQIVVNNYLETNEPHIFAIGDVISAPWLAHKASHEGVLCAEKIAGLKVRPIDPSNIPSCIYATPQIASIGLTEEKALAAGLSIKVGKFPFMANGKALALGEAQGLVKTIFDAATGELLGAHMIGAEVTELIQIFALAKTAELTESELIHTIFAHPTLSEMLHESTLNAFDKSIHI